MAENNFWEEGDVGFMKAWVSDLKKLGYTFPAVHRSHDYHVPTLAPVDPEHPTPQHW
jgi:site-specific DNA-cytosine methylase